eukprot:2052021-Pyramimonas_sp.AAC.1
MAHTKPSVKRPVHELSTINGLGGPFNFSAGIVWAAASMKGLNHQSHSVRHCSHRAADRVGADVGVAGSCAGAVAATGSAE